MRIHIFVLGTLPKVKRQRPVVAQGYKGATVNRTSCGFYSHSKEIYNCKFGGRLGTEMFLWDCQVPSAYPAMYRIQSEAKKKHNYLDMKLWLAFHLYSKHKLLLYYYFFINNL